MVSSFAYRAPIAAMNWVHRLWKVLSHGTGISRVSVPNLKLNISTPIELSQEGAALPLTTASETLMPYWSARLICSSSSDQS